MATRIFDAVILYQHMIERRLKSSPGTSARCWIMIDPADLSARWQWWIEC
mgnify:CR=1 FL=1